MANAMRRKPPTAVTQYQPGTPTGLRAVLEHARRGGVRVRVEGPGWTQEGYVTRTRSALVPAIVPDRRRPGIRLRTRDATRVLHAPHPGTTGTTLWEGD